MDGWKLPDKSLRHLLIKITIKYHRIKNQTSYFKYYEIIKYFVLLTESSTTTENPFAEYLSWGVQECMPMYPFLDTVTSASGIDDIRKPLDVDRGEFRNIIGSRSDAICENLWNWEQIRRWVLGGKISKAYFDLEMSQLIEK